MPVSREADPREEAGTRIARGGYRWVPASDCFAPVKPKSRRQFLAVRQTVPVGTAMAGRTGDCGKPARRRRTRRCKASRDHATRRRGLARRRLGGSRTTGGRLASGALASSRLAGRGIARRALASRSLFYDALLGRRLAGHRVVGPDRKSVVWGMRLSD